MPNNPKLQPFTEKESVKSTTDIVKAQIERLIFTDDGIPEGFLPLYQTSVVMSLLFAELKMGEVFANISYQLARLFNMFKYEYEGFNPELQKLYAEFIRVISDKQIDALKQVQSDSNQDQTKTKK